MSELLKDKGGRPRWNTHATHEICAAFYGRVSTQEQSDGGTINVQLHAWEEHKRLTKLPPDALVVTDDGISGMLPAANRPGASRVLKLAEAGAINRVVVWKLDRLGRGPGDTVSTVERLEKLGVTVQSLTEGFTTGTPQGNFIMGIYAQVAGLERANLLERTMAGRRRTSRLGKWPGGKPPYGFIVNQSGFLEINEEQAKWVRHAAARYLEGVTLQGIARELAALGVPPPRTRWERSSVGRVLHHPIFRGRLALGWTNTRGRHVTAEGQVPRILDEKTCGLIDRIENRGAPAKYREYPLTGLARCGVCGWRLSGNWGKGLPYYRCNSYNSRHHGGHPCGGRAVRADILEELAWESLVEFVSSEATRNAWAAAALQPPEPLEPEVDLTAQRANLESERARLLWMFQQGYFPQVSEFEDRMREWRERSDKLLELESRATGRTVLTRAAALGAVEAARLLAVGIEHVPEIERQEYLRALLAQAVVGTPQTAKRASNHGYREQLRAETSFTWSLEGLVEPG